MRDTKNSLTLIGCGWLGMPLAQIMIQQGWKVKGTTTSEVKRSKLMSYGIEPYLYKLPGPNSTELSLFKSHNLLVGIPPGRRNQNVLHDYPLSISQILQHAREAGEISKVIFISSTSVYGKNDDFIDENTKTNPGSDSGRAMVDAENQICNSGFIYNILRFGGLAGPGRHPGRFLAGKKNLPDGDQLINFLHLDDAIGVIMQMLSGDFDDKIYNVVSPRHPTKKLFYSKMTAGAGLVPPTFDESLASAKREISVQSLLIDTGYQFKYPDPLTYDF